MKLILLPLIIAVLLAVGSFGALDAKKCTTLYTFTCPVQKTCVLNHPYSQELQKARQAAHEYNQGVVAAEKLTATKCPNFSKDFCQGWSSVKNRFWG
jgi:hypothetical protein